MDNITNFPAHSDNNSDETIHGKQFGFFSFFSVLTSCTNNGGVAYGGSIPWAHGCNGDARYITTLSAYSPDPTLINAVIMDQSMFDRIGNIPLKWRFNVVIEDTIMPGQDQGQTNHHGPTPQRRRLYSALGDAGGSVSGPKPLVGQANDNMKDILFVCTLEEALAVLAVKGNINQVYVIGGERLLSQALRHPRCRQALLAIVDYSGVTDEHIDMISLRQLYDLDHQRVKRLRDGSYMVQFCKYVRRGANASTASNDQARITLA